MTHQPRRCSTPTRTVRAGIATDAHHGAVVPPIHLSSTFAFAGFDQKRRYDYTRSGNPTRDHLGDALTTLEEGVGAVVTSSGMSAVALALQLVRHGARGARLLRRYLPTAACARGAWSDRAGTGRPHRDRRGGDDRAMSPGAAVGGNAEQSAAAHHRSPGRIGGGASGRRHRRGGQHLPVAGAPAPAYPGCRRRGPLHDEISQRAQRRRRRRGDCARRGASRDAGLVGQLPWHHGRAVRQLPHPARSTPPVRADARARGERARRGECARRPRRRARGALPGLRTHPGHRIAAGQQAGFGAMVSFALRGGRNAVEEFTAHLQCFTLAESLGGVESLIAHPATMTHASMDAEARRVAGITDGLLGLSVGIESPDDLVADLRGALDAVSSIASAEALISLAPAGPWTAPVAR